MRWLGGITDPVDMNLSKLQEMAKWTEKPGVLQFMGSQTAGHNLATEQPTLTVPPTYSSMFSVQVDECKVLGVISNGGWRRQWRPTPAFLPGKSHGRMSLEGCSPWGR